MLGTAPPQHGQHHCQYMVAFKISGQHLSHNVFLFDIGTRSLLFRSFLFCYKDIKCVRLSLEKYISGRVDLQRT